MKSREREKAKRLAVILGAVVGGACALAAVQLAPQPGWWRVAIPAFIAGAGIVATPVVLLGKAMHRWLERDLELRALINIRPLYGPLPAAFDGWTIDANFGSHLARLVAQRRPRLVVECGSGISTVLVAATLNELGEGRIVSLDHEARFAQRTRDALGRRGLEAWAEVVTAPLGVHRVDGREFRWYGDYESRIPGAIDVLVVDGPPSGGGADARYPAVPLLRRHLAPGCVILMDDGRRRGEAATARRWADELGASLEYLEGGRGAWVIRCGDAPAATAG